MQQQLKITDPGRRAQILREICTRRSCFKDRGIDTTAPLLSRLGALHEYATTVGNKKTEKRVEACLKVAKVTRIETLEQADKSITQERRSTLLKRTGIMIATGVGLMTVPAGITYLINDYFIVAGWSTVAGFLVAFAGIAALDKTLKYKVKPEEATATSKT